MKRNGIFYVVNACADIGRAIDACEKKQFALSATAERRAFETLHKCIELNEWNAYDEGLLLLREYFFARESLSLQNFKISLDAYAVELMSCT